MFKKIILNKKKKALIKRALKKYLVISPISGRSYFSYKDFNYFGPKFMFWFENAQGSTCAIN